MIHWIGFPELSRDLSIHLFTPSTFISLWCAENCMRHLRYTDIDEVTACKCAVTKSNSGGRRGGASRNANSLQARERGCICRGHSATSTRKLNANQVKQ